MEGWEKIGSIFGNVTPYKLLWPQNAAGGCAKYGSQPHIAAELVEILSDKSSLNIGSPDQRIWLRRRQSPQLAAAREHPAASTGGESRARARDARLSRG